MGVVERLGGGRSRLGYDDTMMKRAFVATLLFAMLAVASALSSGELAPLLGKISVIIVPRGNPDGAAADRRVLAGGADPNRDHLLLSQPETRALHRAMRVLPPDVVFDHHEFSVA